MSIPMRCPHCQASLIFEERFAGATGPCYSCNQPVTVGAQTTTPPRASTLARVYMWIAGIVFGLTVVSLLLVIATQSENSSTEAAIALLPLAVSALAAGTMAYLARHKSGAKQTAASFGCGCGAWLLSFLAVTFFFETVWLAL